MLIIRKEQMDILGKYMEEQFVERAVKFLCSTFANEFIDSPRDHLSSLVRDGISKARKYGIEYEDDVMRFLEFMVRYGHDFHEDPEQPQIKEILNSDIDGTAKIILLEDHFETEDEEETWEER